MRKSQLIKLVLFCFLNGLIFLHCTPTKEAVTEISKPLFSSIIFQQLGCNNLSERMAGFGTSNDEILLLAYCINEKNEIIQEWNSGYEDFDENEMTVELADTIGLSVDFNRLLLILVEQDTERSAEELNELAKTHLDIEKLPFVNKLKMQKALKDDDFLDAQVLDLDDLKTKRQVTFWGMQLFDEFEYLLDLKSIQ